VTDPGYVHFVLIIDRSGSMRAIREETQEGIRGFVAGQQGALPAGHRGTLSLYQFDAVHDIVHEFTPLADVPPYHLAPRNATALLDAIGFAVTGEGEKLAAMPERERPGKVVVLIATDGQENSSHEWTKKQVRALIEQQQMDYGWEFTFIGANQDAFAEAGGLGIASPAVLSWAGTSRGTAGAWRGVSTMSARYVSGQAGSLAYTPEERAEAAGGSAADGSSGSSLHLFSGKRKDLLRPFSVA
jgi:hypothetical protein